MYCIFMNKINPFSSHIRMPYANPVPVLQQKPHGNLHLTQNCRQNTVSALYLVGLGKWLSSVCILVNMIHLKWAGPFVMRSSKMSLNFNKMKTQFLIAIYVPYLELYLGDNLTYGLRDITILVLLKTIKYKKMLLSIVS